MEWKWQAEGNNKEDEVGVLCGNEVNGGSSNVRNMTCVRDQEVLETTHTRKAAL